METGDRVGIVFNEMRFVPSFSRSNQAAMQAAQRYARQIPGPGVMQSNLGANLAIYGTLTADVKRFHDRLLESAQRIIDDPDADEGSFAAAITLAGTACEVAVGTTVRTFIVEKSLGPIAEAADAWVFNYNLDDKRIRETGRPSLATPLTQRPFGLISKRTCSDETRSRIRRR
jgi:hypothetical protein